MIRGSLNPGGFLCAYTPTERVKRTVASVFPYVLAIESSVSPFMLASDQPIVFDKAEIRRRFENPELQNYLEVSGQDGQASREIDLFLRTAKVIELTPDNRQGLDVGDELLHGLIAPQRVAGHHLVGGIFR